MKGICEDAPQASQQSPEQIKSLSNVAIDRVFSLHMASIKMLPHKFIKK